MPEKTKKSMPNVGCRALQIQDPVQGRPIPTWVLYPSRAPERVEHFGPYSFSLAMDGAIEGEALPLILISHGRGGFPWVYRDLAGHLARSGCAVGLVEHP